MGIIKGLSIQSSEPRASRPAGLPESASGAAGSRSLTFIVLRKYEEGIYLVLGRTGSAQRPASAGHLFHLHIGRVGLPVCLWSASARVWLADFGGTAIILVAIHPGWCGVGACRGFVFLSDTNHEVSAFCNRHLGLRVSCLDGVAGRLYSSIHLHFRGTSMRYDAEPCASPNRCPLARPAAGELSRWPERGA